MNDLPAANDAFYAAFEALDLDRMSQLWLHSPDAYCVHPGAELITGWEPIRRSWAVIFASTSYLQFIVTDVVVRAGGDVGIVTCTENILAGEGDDELGGGRALATNVFAREGGDWRMLGHHASPVLRSVS